MSQGRHALGIVGSHFQTPKFDGSRTCFLRAFLAHPGKRNEPHSADLGIGASWPQAARTDSEPSNTFLS